MERDHAIELLTADPASTGLFTDFDGTLSDIADHPEDAVPVAGALDLLEVLAAAYGRVAVISGRSLEDLRFRFRPTGVVLAGSYGRERSDRPGRRHTEGWESVTVAAVAVAERLPGVVVERKGVGVAFHFRSAPGLSDDVMAAADDLAQVFELQVRPGRLVVELTAPGPGKGDALERLSAERELKTVMFAGDDVADLEAFQRARAMDVTSVLVGVVSDESPPQIAEAADLVLARPADVIAFLTELTPLR